MGFLFSGLFWGVIIILVGFTVILKAVFHIDIPLFRIVFALVLIYFGVKVLVGGFHGSRDKPTVLFGESQMEVQESEKEYTVVFGKGLLDLSGVNPENRKTPVEFTTVFGQGTLKIDPGTPLRLKVSSAFAGARLPDGTNIAFGDYTYTSPSFDADEPFLDLEATVVFGNLVVEGRESD